MATNKLIGTETLVSLVLLRYTNAFPISRSEIDLLVDTNEMVISLSHIHVIDPV